MELERQNPFRPRLFHFPIDAPRRLDAVALRHEPMSLRDHAILVPVAPAHRLCDLIAVRGLAHDGSLAVFADLDFFAPFRKKAPAALFIEVADKFALCIDVRLITLNDGITEIDASILNTAISRQNSHFQSKLEIRNVALKDQERVVICLILFGRLAGYGTISNRPHPIASTPALYPPAFHHP